MNGLKDNWNNLLEKYSQDKQLNDILWQEIEEAYSYRGRYYHTLSHLENIFSIIEKYREKVIDYDAICFATWYHDIIYNTYRSDNEEKSAEFARQSLIKLQVPDPIISKVISLILITKTHQPIENTFDEFLFLDADLSILGSNPEEYNKYAEGVRKEFKQYPDLLYNPGRKKVLKHFLEAKQIFKTLEIGSLLEEQARVNLQAELNRL